MKILITIAHLEDFAGSELYTIDLSKELASMGHTVVLYSPILGKIAKTIDNFRNITLINNLELVKNEKFDIIHIQHNVTAWMARKYFPSTPAIMVVHGIIPKLEQPPKINLGIHKYVAVSSGIKSHLIQNHHIVEQKIVVQNNWVNTQKFFPKNIVGMSPKKLMVLSNHLDSEQEKIYRKVCKERGIKFFHVGLPENPVKNVQDYINKADVVVTVGRGAIEAMACGRNVIVSDINGIDGMVTPKTYEELVKNNFSGHRYHRKLTYENFKRELNKYSREYTEDLIQLIIQNHSPQAGVQKIISIYKEVQKKKVRIDPNYVKSLLEIEILTEYLVDFNYIIRKSKEESKG